MSNFLTVKEAAKMLKVSAARVRHFIDEGRLEATWDERLQRITIDPATLSSFQKIKRPTGKHLTKEN